MGNEMQRISEYYDRRTALDMDYRSYMERQAVVATDVTNNLDQIKGAIGEMQTGITTAINDQTFALVASQAALAHTFNQGFDRINNTLDMGFYGISKQLGEMTASFSMGFAMVENALDRMADIMKNPLLTQSREFYRRAAERSKKGQFEEALEDTQAALEKDRADYTAWFLQGKIYALGASKYSNVIDLDKSIDALTKAARYNEPNIKDSIDARKRSAEIYFYLGVVYYAKSNELLRENKKPESSEMLIKSQESFKQSCQCSSDMLESLFNVARINVIKGEVDNAIRNLETLVLRDRNYCIKVYSNEDFSSIGAQFTNLIYKLKNAAFSSAKTDYDVINTTMSQLKSIGGHTEEKVPSSFSETLPYFDILDFAKDFKRILPIVREELTNKKEEIADEKRRREEAQRSQAEKYDGLVQRMGNAKDKGDYSSLAQEFRWMADFLGGYRDSAVLARKCEARIRGIKRKWVIARLSAFLLWALSIVGGALAYAYGEGYRLTFAINHPDRWGNVGVAALACAIINTLPFLFMFFSDEYNNGLKIASLIVTVLLIIITFFNSEMIFGVILYIVCSLASMLIAMYFRRGEHMRWLA